MPIQLGLAFGWTAEKVEAKEKKKFVFQFGLYNVFVCVCVCVDIIAPFR